MTADPALDLNIANRFAAAGDVFVALRVLELALLQEPDRADLRERYEELLHSLPQDDAERVRNWDANFEHLVAPDDPNRSWLLRLAERIAGR